MASDADSIGPTRSRLDKALLLTREIVFDLLVLVHLHHLQHSNKFFRSHFFKDALKTCLIAIDLKYLIEQKV